MSHTDIIIPTYRPRGEVEPLVSEIIRTAGCHVNVIATCQQISAAANRNLGLDQSTSDPLLMVDDDMEQFPQGWVVRLVAVLEQYPKCVMVSPRLATPNGEPGIMMGCGEVQRDGITECGERKLLTACIAIRRNTLRFDENFIGSGWEDSDYSKQLCAAFPDATFLVCHDLWAVHRNEMKNQSGPYWDHNKSYFERKWGVA